MGRVYANAGWYWRYGSFAKAMTGSSSMMGEVGQARRPLSPQLKETCERVKGE